MSDEIIVDSGDDEEIIVDDGDDEEIIVDEDIYNDDIETTYLFKLVSGSTMLDLTNYITVPSYKINRNPVYTEWTDGNLKVRHDVHRFQISGSFTLLFTKKKEYLEFLETYQKAVDYSSGDGSVNVYLYVNNINEVVNTQVFMTFELSDTMPYMGMKEIDGIEITIQEL